MTDDKKTPDGSTENIPDEQKADTQENPPDTASGGAPEPA